jgi:hypothetical protein
MLVNSFKKSKIVPMVEKIFKTMIWFLGILVIINYRIKFCNNLQIVKLTNKRYRILKGNQEWTT